MSKMNKHCNIEKTHFGTLCRRLMSIFKKKKPILAVRFYEEVHSPIFRKDKEEGENKVIKSEL